MACSERLRSVAWAWLLSLSLAGGSRAESVSAAARGCEEGGAATRQVIASQLAELETLRLQVEERLAQLESATDVRVARLAELHGRMPAERAAAVIEALDLDLAARILSQMRPSRAARLLAALPEAHAAELSRRLVRPRPAAAAATPVAGSGPAAIGTGASSAP
jgi:flagellar motility protein MotE (MotC chaperone)